MRAYIQLMTTRAARGAADRIDRLESGVRSWSDSSRSNAEALNPMAWWVTLIRSRAGETHKEFHTP